MTDTLTPVERTNWALSAWNSTLDWNDVPSAWLYGQDHLWATQDLVGNSGPRMFTWGALASSLPTPPMIHGYPTDSDIISSDFIAVYLSLHIALHCDMLKVQLNINFKHY